MLITLKQMTGMPLVWQGQAMGEVDHGVTDPRATRLLGLVVRHGLGAAKWVPSQGISLIGRQCIVAALRPMRLPEHLPRLSRMAYRTDGSLLGEVTDAVISSENLAVVALEISESLLGRMMGQRRYALEFCQAAEHPGKTVVASLCTLAEMRSGLKEE